MKNRFLMQAAFSLAALMVPVSAWSQFQAPTEEELKMTSEPKAPGGACA